MRTIGALKTKGTCKSPASEVEATAAALEAQFPPERLRTLIDNGGWDPVTTTEAASQ